MVLILRVVAEVKELGARSHGECSLGALGQSNPDGPRIAAAGCYATEASDRPEQPSTAAHVSMHRTESHRTELQPLDPREVVCIVDWQ